MLAALLPCATLLGAPERVPSLLLGGGQPRAPERTPATDPALRRGPNFEQAKRPEQGARLCSSRMPVCVHTAPSEPRDANAALLQLEGAYERLVFVLGLPAPLADTAGGGPELDLYLLAGTASATRLRVELDRPLAESDRAPTFCVAPGAVTEQAAARCVAGAIAAALDCAESPQLREAYSAHLAQSWFGPDATLLEAVDDLQANPQANPFAPDATLSLAAASWLAFVDERLSAELPGTLSTALLAVSRAAPLPDPLGARSLTRDPHPEWHNEPDVFDVLRSSLPGDPQLRSLGAEWALSRAFLGSRSDGAHAPGHAWLGNFGKLSFDWVFTYSSLPRNVAAARALEPMGTTAIWLELDSVPLGAELGMRVEWEAPVSFAWLVVAVDAQGREQRRWELPHLERGTKLEKTLLNFEQAAGLLFVGINLGGVDLAHPFDPDAYPWEPHSYTLYLANLE